jgi:hypothetical protein
MQYMSMNNLSLFFRIRHGFSADNGGNSSICNHFAAINRKICCATPKCRKNAGHFLHRGGLSEQIENWLQARGK